jgi:hypothetical protein
LYLSLECSKITPQEWNAGILEVTVQEEESDFKCVFTMFWNYYINTYFPKAFERDSVSLEKILMPVTSAGYDDFDFNL